MVINIDATGTSALVNVPPSFAFGSPDVRVGDVTVTATNMALTPSMATSTFTSGSTPKTRC